MHKDTELETALAKNEQHHEPRINMRLDRHEQWRDSVWTSLHIWRQLAKPMVKSGSSKKVVGGVDAQNR